MGVCIQTPYLFMEIKIMSINDLYIHEETIPYALEQLKSELKTERILKHPMIVDSKTLVVLDGMHRVAALRALDLKLAPVCLVDYQNPTIELFAWYREFEGTLPLSEFIKKISDDLPYIISKNELTSAIELVKNREAFSAIAQGTQVYSLKFSKKVNIKESYDAIDQIEEFASRLCYSICYSTESDALKSSVSYARPIMIVPSLTKHEVIDAALKGKLYPQKTTRHIVPARPLFVNIPIDWLTSTNSEEVNNKMKEHLEKKRIIRKKPGAIIDGRRYEEWSYIFTEP